MKVVALIPAYNEKDNIIATLRSVAKIPVIAKILVINDASTDETGELVERFAEGNHKLHVLNLANNLGKGGALNQGLRAAEADVYLLLDGDLGETAALAVDLLEPVLKGEADMTIARFGPLQTDSTSKAGFGFVRRFASRGVYFLTKTRINNPLSGQRALTNQLIAQVGPFFPGFGVEIGLTVGALKHGFRLLEVPLAMRHKGYGRGLAGIRHRGRQFIHVVKALWLCKLKGWY